jgi:hypothetical protein
MARQATRRSYHRPRAQDTPYEDNIKSTPWRSVMSNLVDLAYGVATGVLKTALGVLALVARSSGNKVAKIGAVGLNS